MKKIINRRDFLKLNALESGSGVTKDVNEV